MRIISSAASMQKLARQWKLRGVYVTFVPTMGYLHDGHLSLVRVAHRRAGINGKVVVSIYVNPAQFAPTEDLAKYPRDLKRDLELCREAGVDVAFTPSDEEMYPAGSSRCDGRMAQRAVPINFSTYVVEEELSQTMEGVARPKHFRGVTTVVAKLFNLVLPDVAVFGQKDFQQAAIIRRMVADLNFPVEIIIAPTLREADGLAMSSRNKFLDAEQRGQAVILFHALRAASLAVKKKPIPAGRLKADLKEFIGAASQARLDYVEFFNPKSLAPVTQVKRGMQMALAVFIGKTRLIDNARL